MVYSSFFLIGRLEHRNRESGCGKRIVLSIGHMKLLINEIKKKMNMIFHHCETFTAVMRTVNAAD